MLLAKIMALLICRARDVARTTRHARHVTHDTSRTARHGHAIFPVGGHPLRSCITPPTSDKTKLKLDKEVGGGGGISERTREPNERTGGTGERPESTSGPRGASATDRGGISERTRERHERTGGTSERPYMTSGP